MRLYHFTCGHGAVGIEATRTLRPHSHPLLGRKLIWLTDLPSPDRYDVGLTSTLLHCDRMEYRATVDAEARHWPEFVRSLPLDTRRVARDLTSTFGLPMHWYVADEEVPILSLERFS